jgi:hypothetical protein
MNFLIFLLLTFWRTSERKYFARVSMWLCVHIEVCMNAYVYEKACTIVNLAWHVMYMHMYVCEKNIRTYTFMSAILVLYLKTACDSAFEAFKA